MASNHPYPFPHESGFEFIFFKKKKEGKERKGKRVMWLASRLAFSFFGMEGALSSKKEPKKGSGNAERNRVTSHGMDPRGQIVHLTSSR